MLKIIAAAAAASLLAAPVLAQGAPANMTPTRDVSVTYRVSGLPGVQGDEMRMAWSISDGKQRIDPPGGMGWMLIDRRAGSAMMVMDAQRMVMTLPAQAAASMTQSMPPDARFTRKGTARVAGQSCTEWDVTMPDMRSTVCMTDDGVMLRSQMELPQNGGTSRMEATEVRYGAQEAGRFQVPQGYQPMQMPGQIQGAAPGVPAGKPPAR
jgi:hypothetical protein